MASGDTLCIFTPLENEPPTSNFATIDFRNNHPVLDFDGNADEEAVFSGILPRNYAGGGLTVTLYVMFTSATSGTVRFQADIERLATASQDLDSDGFTGSFQSNGGSAPGTSGHLLAIAITFTSGAQMDSLAAGENFRLKLRRDADGTSGTDNITSDCELKSLEIKET